MELTAKECSTSPLFLRACQLAGIEPTQREAARWLREQGRAWAAMKRVRPHLKPTHRR